MCIMRLLDVGGTNLAQWRHKMPIYYGWRWHGMLTTERQQYSENPGGTPRQCISVCPWKLAQPIAGYRRSTRLILNPQWHKRLHAAYFYLFLCWRSLQNTWFYFLVLRELDTWLDLTFKANRAKILGIPLPPAQTDQKGREAASPPTGDA